MVKPAVSQGVWLRELSNEALSSYIDELAPGFSLDCAKAERARRAGIVANFERLVWLENTFWASVLLGGVSVLIGVSAVMVALFPSIVNHRF